MQISRSVLYEEQVEPASATANVLPSWQNVCLRWEHVFALVKLTLLFIGWLPWCTHALSVSPSVSGNIHKYTHFSAICCAQQAREEAGGEGRGRGAEGVRISFPF